MNDTGEVKRVAEAGLKGSGQAKRYRSSLVLKRVPSPKKVDPRPEKPVTPFGPIRGRTVPAGHPFMGRPAPKTPGPKSPPQHHSRPRAKDIHARAGTRQCALAVPSATADCLGRSWPRGRLQCYDGHSRLDVSHTLPRSWIHWIQPRLYRYVYTVPSAELIPRRTGSVRGESRLGRISPFTPRE